MGLRSRRASWSTRAASVARCGGACRRSLRRAQTRTHANVCTAAQWRYQVRNRDGAVRFLARYGAAPGGTPSAFPSLAGGFSTLTFFTSRALDHIGLLTGTIPALGAPSAAALMDRFVTRAPWLGERLFGGQGAIPLRRPYATLARDRAALIGDAGCMVYASHGSGVGMGLIAARLLADASAGDGDPGAPAALARYERSLHSRFGPLLSAADAFRRFSQGLSYDDVVAMFDAGLLDAALAGKALEQQPEVDSGQPQALRALTSGARRCPQSPCASRCRGAHAVVAVGPGAPPSPGVGPRARALGSRGRGPRRSSAHVRAIDRRRRGLSPRRCCRWSCPSGTSRRRSRTRSRARSPILPRRARPRR